MPQRFYYELLAELISHLDLKGSSVEAGWSEVEYEFLLFCLKNNVVHMGNLRNLVKLRLRKIGRENFLLLLGHNLSLRDLPSPVALAYAFDAGELLPFEIDQMPLTIDQAEQFMEDERKKLVSVVVRQLTNWKFKI